MIHIAFDSNAFVYLLSELNPSLSLLICLSLVCLINRQALWYTHLGKPRGLFFQNGALSSPIFPHKSNRRCAPPVYWAISHRLWHWSDSGWGRTQEAREILKNCRRLSALWYWLAPFCIQEEWMEVEDNHKSALRLPDSANKTQQRHHLSHSPSVYQNKNLWFFTKSSVP